MADAGLQVPKQAGLRRLTSIVKKQEQRKQKITLTKNVHEASSSGKSVAFAKSVGISVSESVRRHEQERQKSNSRSINTQSMIKEEKDDGSTKNDVDTGSGKRRLQSVMRKHRPNKPVVSSVFQVVPSSNSTPDQDADLHNESIEKSDGKPLRGVTVTVAPSMIIGATS